MAAKTPTVNINVIQTQPVVNENEKQHEDESGKAKKRKESAAILPGNEKKCKDTTLVFNFTFGNEFATLFKPNHAALNVPATNIGPAPNSVSSLLPPSLKPGNNMSITSFCALYKLDDSIAAKFASNSFKEACLLRYVTFADLKEMEFKIGEIAALHDAVETWSIHSDA
ncbi:hypothetical protein BDR07DRAFT_1371868 [Suillus spraguei]|nr:hypothetical protein BDR07DRAFT_1371868 [Suillus spraguei]